MRLLLLQSSAYIPSLGGANKANRLLLEQLAARGHECHVIGTAGESRAESAEHCLAGLAAAGVEGAAPLPDDPGVVGFRHAGVTVEAVLDGARLRAHAAARLRRLAPDRVLVSSEDPAQILLREAVTSRAAPAVYIAHTTLHLPFGPDGFLASPAQTDLLRQTAGIIAVSDYVRGYLRRWAGLESTLLRFPVYGTGPFPNVADAADGFEGGAVTLINPCAVKGISIFLALARRCPDLRFAAVPTWGTTGEDRAALAALPNVEILEPTADIDRLFARCRVLLVPSLWGEAFGQVAVEAMLRGVPVLASDAGGLPEAVLGTGRVLPVRPIRRYEERFDERKIPVAVVPEQEIGPWEEALRAVLADPEGYRAWSAASQRAALAFVSGLGIEPFEQYLEGLAAPAAGGAAGRRMKILLVQPLAYLFSHGGAHKANRLLLQGLAARGHRCRVVAPRSAAEEGAEAPAASEVFDHEGVEVHAVADGLELCAEAARQIRDFEPDWTIVSEDSTGRVLQEVLEAAPARAVYLAHSLATLPFGPASFGADAAVTGLLRRTAGILTVSRAMQDYIRRWAGLESTVVYSPAYGSGPFPALGAFDRGYVTMINPSGIKGVSVFAGLARRLPGVAFAAVPTWSTTAADRGLLTGLPNVTLLPAVDDVDELFAQVRVLVVPSLWGEAFGQVVIEALLRGIPVLTSDQGGLPEAGLGVTRIVPVRPIERYEERLDDRRMPVPVVPEQNLDRWEAELRSLLADRDGYRRLSAAAREAAARFISGLGIAPYERFLADLAPAPPAGAAPMAGTAPAADVRQKLAGLSPEKLELLARRLKKKEGAPPPVTGIPRLPRSNEPGGDRFPLSFAQQRLWFLDRFEPGSLAYNEHFALRLNGRVEVRLLAAALDRIRQRHEALRTTYAESGDEPVQIVHPARPGDRVALPLADLGGLPEVARQSEAARLATAESRRPFDLGRGPLMRVLLLGLGAADSLLLITAHHIAVDNWSASVVFAELSALYGAWEAGRAPALPELPVQYADFAAWQRGWLTGEVLEGQLGFWRRQLAGAPALLDLPADRPRPARQSFRGSRVMARFSAPLAEAVRALARRRDATPYMLLLAVFQTLLHRVSGQDDLVVGTPVAGRNRKEIEPLIGFFLNTLPMRTRLAPGATFQALLDGVRQTALDAFAHQDLPFERLVEALAPERSLSHAALFQVLFNFLNVPPRAEELPGGVRLTAATVQTGTTRFDLELYMEEQDPGLVVALDFNTDLFDAATATRLLVQLEALLTGVTGRPDAPLWALPVLTPAQAHQLLQEWNDTAAGWTGPGVHQLFAAQALRTPTAPAVAFQGETLTYAELAERAGRLASRLRVLGCGAESRVGIALERSLDLPAALLGVLGAGSAYVPLDPDYPRERLALVLEDAAPRVLITEEHLLHALPRAPGTVVFLHDLPAAGFLTDCDGRQLAYVLYTSGSTGRPKGVGVPHRALANFLQSMRREPGFAAGERLLAVTSIAFDIAALEIFLPLITGGCVELASREEAADGARLAARLRASGAGVMQATPATWRMLLESGWTGDPGLVALCGGEALPRGLAAALAGCTRELWNLYGPTETTVWSTTARVLPGEAGPVSIGRPIAATRVHLLDRELQTVPLGVPGELCIGGAGLARGYLGRPELTAERFVPDPLASGGGEAGGRLYRTGDLARHLPGGRMEVLGRLDHQIKLRGFRIELGEIEAALARHPAVREAVVALRGHGTDARLVAYLVPAGEVPGEGELRDFLRASLTEPMIPAAFVTLSALPLTPNRKVDRRALPAPGPAAEAPSAAPRTPVEELLAGIWAEVLGRERVGIHESFFDLGGHSLLVTRVVSRLRDVFGIELPLRALFEQPTVAELALAVAAGRGAAAPPLARLAPTPAASRDRDLPLSFAQERLWFLDQLEPGNAAYHIAAAFTLSGRLDLRALDAAYGEIQRRHEALRTTFAEADGRPVQRIAPPAALFVPVVDLTGLASGERSAAAERLTAEAVRRAFDLARGPLARLLLLRLGPAEHRAVLVLHHIVADGWSMGVLVQELTALYAAGVQGAPSPLREPAVQYADYAVWQRGRLHGEALAELLARGRRRLEKVPLVLELPADRPRPPVPSGRGGRRATLVPGSPVQALSGLARREGSTLFMALLALFDTLLHRYTGRDDVIVGTDVANRTQAETEALIGFFVNQLVLRADLSGDPPFRRLLARVRDAALDAYADQDLPFDHLVEALNPERDLSRAPVFQVAFVLQNVPATALELPGLTLEPVTADSGAARLDLAVEAVETGAGLEIRADYSDDLFEAATIDRLLTHFAVLLRAAADAPETRLSRLSLLTEPERHQVLQEWNDRAARFPGGPGATFPRLFSAAAAARPHEAGALCGEEERTYGELERLSGRLARALAAQGIGAGAVVALLADRGLDFLTAVLGILRAGATYLPLDPGHPRHRLAQVIADSGARLALAGRRLAPLLDETGEDLAAAPPLRILEDLLDGKDEPPAVPLPELEPGDLAYLLYTSGSTGVPKGALIHHGGMLNHLWAKVDDLGLGVGDLVAQTAGQCFDISLWQLLAPLLAGGRVRIVPDEVAHDPARLFAEVDQRGVTVLETVPSLLRIALDELEAAAAGDRPGLAALRWLIPTGEVLPPELCHRWLRLYAGVPLLNAYGPTECSDDVTHHVVRPGGVPERAIIPIGRPVANLRVYVLDRALEPLPCGVPGELFAGGTGVGRGYLGDAVRTALSFPPDPFAGSAGARLYRTGDLARLRADGTLELLGRIDHQVKIRGHRIELGEIESVLAGHPLLSAAAVIAREGGVGEGLRLVAYVVPRPEAGSTLLAERLRELLAERLPAAMIPSAFVVLDALPLTPNGKLDRRALPAPQSAEATETAADFTPPRTPVEELLAGVFAEVLQVERVGLDDDFFALGGHSLLATQVISRVKRLGVSPPLRGLFERPTVRGFAELVGSLLAAPGLEAPRIAAAPRHGEIPLSFAQQRLWFLDQLVPGSPFYNMPATLRFHGLLDVTALAASLGEIVRRHESLRTTFPVRQGHPVQHIAPPPPPGLPLADLSGLPAAARQGEARRLAVEESLRPFDLARGPLLRATLARLEATEHLLLSTLHHVISDGWSNGVLRGELTALYQAFAAGGPSPLPELPIQYADFAIWQRQWLQGEVLEAQLGYWRERLADPPTLDLPTDRPRPAVNTFRGGMASAVIPAGLRAALGALGRRRGATPYMVLLAAWKALLHRASGQADLLVGTPIANRNRAEIEGLIGFFVNTLALRTDLSGEPTFIDLVQRVREVSLGAYARQDLPFEKLVEELHPERDTGRNPLFQVSFVLQNFPSRDAALPGLAMRPVEVGQATAKFDLTLYLFESAEGLPAAVEYSTDLFDGPTIRRMLDRFLLLLTAVAAEPELRLDRLPVMAEAERHQVLREWNDVPGPRQQRCLHELVAAQALRTPEAPAVVFAGRTLTYVRLMERARLVASRLRGLGCGPGSRVGVAMERSIELPVALLGTLAAGAAYVPLDPEYPRERLAALLEDAQPAALLVQERLMARLPVLEAPVLYLDGAGRPVGTGATVAPAADQAGEADGRQLAYVIYTSGSTGRPKGVMVPHGAIVNRLLWMQETFPLTAADAVLQKTPFSFDASVWELFSPLLAGARLVMAPPGAHRDPAAMAAEITAGDVTVLQLVPSMLGPFLDDEAAGGCRSLRRVFCGGEALPAPLRDRLFDRLGATTLCNLYGPTECAIDATFQPCRRDDGRPVVAIGRPLSNVQVYLLDRGLRPTALGVPGELCVGGAALARGYLGRQDLTAERFVPDPFSPRPGGRLYRTGDLACHRPDGTLEFLGRVDHQVKVRGFRIEPGEIESALAAHPAVREAVVLAREDVPGDRRLVAYLVREPEAPLEPASAWNAEQVEQWRSVFDGSYGQRPAEADPDFDITGWNSAYTGLPIPEAEMREWVDDSVGRILAEQPRRVLEIGCGTGLLLFRIAPHVELYRATDFSEVAVADLRRRLEGRGLSQVELERRSADDFSGVEPGRFDAVVLNSVVQYFPGVDYLVEVLERAMAVLAPGGFVFLGDLRSLPLLEALHASVELHRATGDLAAEELARRVRLAVAREEELVLDPELLLALRHHLPRIGQVEVQLRRGRAHNELTRFRYDAVLRTRPGGQPDAAERLDWRRAGLSLAGLRERLERDAPGMLELSAVPNARLAGELERLGLLPSGGAVDPERLWELEGELPYRVAVTESVAGPGLMDVRLVREDRADTAGSFPARDVPPRPWSAWANDPLAGKFAQRIVPRLRDELARKLPEHMVPSAFVLLDALPRLPSGKLDRRALPHPERPRSEAGVYVAPRNALEQAIAEIWQEVLGLDRVGRDDNFFDVGGHSLLMIQVHARLRERLGRALTVVELFQYPTVRALAGFLDEETPQEPPRLAAPTPPPRSTAGFAIVGMAGRFPGAGSVEALWDGLRAGREAVVPFADEEMTAAGVRPEMLAHPRYVKAGPVLEGIELFDAEFFGYSPREAEMMDPQHRLFLEASWQALEAAGYDPRGVPGRVGVWGGADMSTYAFHLLSRPDLLQAAGLWATQHGIDKDFLATRVSYELNLKGPSLAVQTACSTSLVAVHLACRSLADGECDMALAGGVHVHAPQRTGYLYEEGAISSPDGHCRAFDARARGTFSGSGVGVVVLKRLEDARRDGDTIRAVIRGTAINNDGSLKVGFTAPGVDGQAEVIAAAQAAAGVPPDTIGYVEAHGTGTPLGDPIEVAALTRAFRRPATGTERKGFCGLGSIKTNIGHLGAAAGVAGLIKTALALEHRQIPPSLHFETPNPAIDFAASPFRVVDRLTDWEADSTPRRAGVSSFGIGGTNAHAVLEEAPAAEPSGASRPRQLLLLSARTAGALEEATDNLAGWLARHPNVPLADVAHTLRRGRHPFEHRRMLVCASREDALAALEARDPERLLTRRRESDPPAVAWLLPGQGSQHPGMGRDLYDSEPAFRREVDACAGILSPRLGRGLREILFSDGPELTQTRFAQPALFVIEHALARLWLSWGLRPRALIGHSLGEYVAACLAGVLSLGDALTLVAARGELMQELPPGAMLSADLSEGEALAEASPARGLSLAAVNGPGQCVLSGPAEEIGALAVRLERRGVPCRRLHTSHAFHSGMMEPILGRFAGIVARVELRPPSIPYLSNLTGTWITAAEATDPRTWVRHLRETVRFGNGVSRLLAELPGAVLLEVGPGKALGRLVRHQAAGRPVLASLPHPGGTEAGAATLLQAVGRLWLAGVEIDWRAFQGEERRCRVPLPTYPFQRRRYWVDAAGGHLPAAVGRPALAASVASAAPVALLVPEGAAADPAWIAGLEARGYRVVTASPGADLDTLLAAPASPAAEPEPAAAHGRPGIDTPYEEPVTEAERRLAEIWGALLGIDRVGLHDDFFELGGHSLLATRLISRVREAFGREVPLEAVFAAPTVARFAARLETGGEPQASQASPILPVPRTGDLPLSFAQQQIWVLQQFDLDSPAYSLPAGFHLRGTLDFEAVAWSLRQVVARHEVLRTTFPVAQGWPVQRIGAEAAAPLPVIDLGHLEEAPAWSEVRSLLVRDALRPFDLAQAPAFRALLIRLAADDHVLGLSFHHICFDGWSWGVLFSELAALYTAHRVGRPSPLPPLSLQYADFARWQRDRAAEIEGQLDWWRERLTGQVPLRLAPERLPTADEPAGAVETFLLEGKLSGALQALAQAEGCTLFMVLLALFKTLLHQRTGREDISVGSPVAGRLTMEIEGLIGNFVNTVVLRTTLVGNSPFRELLNRVKETTLGALAHQETPYEQVAAALLDRKNRRARLFEVWFVLHNTPAPALELPGLTAGTIAVQGATPRHDLSLSLWPDPQGLSAALEYRTDLFPQSAVRQMAEDFTTLAQAVVEDASLNRSTLAGLLGRAQREQQETRKQIAKVASLERLRATRREAV